MDVVPGRQVHDSVCTPDARPLQLLHFFFYAAAYSGVAKVCIDLCQKILPCFTKAFYMMTPLLRLIKIIEGWRV